MNFRSDLAELIMIENSYGIVKRLDYVEKAIAECKPKAVLDFGCGTGELLTVPLTKSFPEIKFVGVDDDRSSIEFAREKNAGLDNLTFSYPDELDRSAKFDLIIASEVIEHVEHPEELLAFLRDKLEAGGRMIVTLPNGYGPFEATSFFEAMLYRIGIDAAAIYRHFRKSGSSAENSVPSDGKCSLAISPHINFFSYGEICRLIAGNGLEITNYQPRTFLCGVGFDQILRGKFLTSWNSRLADSLPPWTISDWMFTIVENKSDSSGNPAVYERNQYAIFRRGINEKRWGMR